MCNYDFSLHNQLKSDFDFKWEPLNKSLIEEPYLVKSFSFTSSNSLESYSFSGKYGKYLDGGYIYAFNSTKKDIALDLKILEENNWIDNFTRAVIIEFSAYNPNLNVYCYCYILFEILPTGNFINSAFFRPLILINPSKNLFFFICAIVYLIGISILFLKEIFILYKENFNYFKKFSILISWGLIIFSCITLSIFVIRHETEKSVIQKINQKQYVNLHLIAFWTDKLDICLGCCSFLGIIKFLSLFRFISRIFYFCENFKSNFRELFYFSLIFLLLLIAFVQLFYFLLNDKLLEYSSFENSLGSSIKIMLRKANNQFNNNHLSILVPIISLFYYLMIALISINIFKAIIINNYFKSKANENEFKSCNFIKNKMEKWLKIKEKKQEKPVYKDFEDGLFLKLEEKVCASISENYYLQKY